MNPLYPINEIQHHKLQLFRNVRSSNWREVVKAYKEHAEIHSAEITSSGDTALHVAISYGEESAVKDLVRIVSETTGRGALEKKNGLGNTPLHLAAYVGSARMCYSIASLDPQLIGIRNDDYETPFFVAVRYGHNEAFHVLHSLCERGKGYNYSRGNDGDTILHSAISGDYFDLAFDIMNLYERLGLTVNAQGVSPLHILANKPEAFPSGSNVRGYHKLIYHCISVDELQQNTLNITRDVDLQYKEGSVYPRNYHTCALMFTSLWNVIRASLRLRTNYEESEIEDKEHHQPNKEHPRTLTGIAQGHGPFPINYTTFFNFVKFISKALLVILGSGSIPVDKIREQKVKHIWSVQIMEKLLEHADSYKDEDSMLYFMEDLPKYTSDIETPILIAAKNGVVEMVDRILQLVPEAVHDVNNEEKNIVLLAAEHRQTDMYIFLLRWPAKGTIFRKTDKDGNSALHLAARLGMHRPWLIPALQMQWEIKWYEFVRDSMPLNFFPRHNNLSETPSEIFSKTHNELAKEGGAWLTNTSQSCSVVAALIVTVAFPTSATLPGGVKSDNSGIPSLEHQPVFSIFAISSLAAFYFSAIAVVMFLALLTSRYEQKDFGKDLPRKLLLGLTSLFISIGSMLLSFCGGHFFVLKEKLQYAALPLYAITFLPIAFFTVAQFPFYFDLVWATWKKVPPKRSTSK